jgi:hypothetical protein
MAISVKYKNAKGTLGSSAAALVTAGSNRVAKLEKITLHGGTSSSDDTELYIYASGGSASASTRFRQIASIPSGETVSVPLNNHNLRDGDVLAGRSGTGAAINYIVSYIEIAE